MKRSLQSKSKQELAGKEGLSSPLQSSDAASQSTVNDAVSEPAAAEGSLGSDVEQNPSSSSISSSSNPSNPSIEDSVAKNDLEPADKNPQNRPRMRSIDKEQAVLGTKKPKISPAQEQKNRIVKPKKTIKASDLMNKNSENQNRPSKPALSVNGKNAAKVQKKDGKQNGKSSSRNDAGKKASAKNDSKKKSLWLIIAIAAAGVVLALILLWSAWPKQDPSDSGFVLAKVNDKPILRSSFDFQYNLLPETYRQSFSKEQVLEQIIDEELVVQAARKEGFNVSLQEVNERVQKVLGASGISLGELQENLDRYNITQEQFELLVERQILIERYLKERIVVAPVDESTATALYESTKNQFMIPEKVTVRHILVSAQRADSALLSKSIYDSVKAGANFCDYVKNSSDDKGSRDTCGVYTFPRGFMVPEFEKASFDMLPQEFRMVQTSFGYHIINKINSTPESIKPYSEVKDQITAEIESADRAQQYRLLVAGLRSKSTIVYANGTVIMPVQQPSISAAKTDSASKPNDLLQETKPAAPEEDLPAETPKEDVVKNSTTSADAQSAGTTTGTATGTTAGTAAVIQAEPVNASSNRTAFVEPANPAELESSNNPLDDASNSMQTSSGLPLTTEQKLSCVSKHAVLYGIDWSSDSQSARSIFSKANVALSYVDCGTADCKQAGVVAYPTWKIDGRLYMGKLSIDELSSIAGC